MSDIIPSKKNIQSAYKFFRKSDETWIEAIPEIWQWEAYYDDGTEIKQFGDDGIFHQFQEIDQSKLAIFKMVSPIYANSYTLLFDEPEMKLIHFYRNTVLNVATEDEQKIKMYCFGYEKRIGKTTQKVIMAITPANELIVTRDIDIITVG